MEKSRYQQLGLLQKILVFASLGASVSYLFWRAGTLNPEAIVFSALLYGAELYGFCTVLMHLFIVWRLPVREPPPPPAGLSVDVFVPTINEPVELVRRTLLAALDMEYPHRTLLLDDGRRPAMEALAQQLGCVYLTRGDNRDSKAGNLNNALAHSSADLIAIFDADHAPLRHFLTRTLGYFRTAEVAFVQTPQDFFNLDSYQHRMKRKGSEAWHEQSVFFRVIQRGKDYWNAAFFCGSCAVMRRSALDAIGGFATGTVTEDLHTSIKLHKKGYRSVYHPESLAYGLAPATLGVFLLQRIRWGQGAMQVWRQERVATSPALSLPQKINYIASMTTYFDGWQKGLYYLAPVIVLTTGLTPISSFGGDFLAHFLPYFLLNLWLFEEVNRGYGRGLAIERFNMARFAAMATSTLGLVKRKIPFAVTPKIHRAEEPGIPRFLFPQLLLFTANTVAIPIGITVHFLHPQLAREAVIANVIWASVNALLGLSVLLLSLKKRFRRQDYRFPLPLPARMELAQSLPLLGTIDDISSSGFRFYGPVPAVISPGSPLRSEIFLPSGSVPIVGAVRTLNYGGEAPRRYLKSIGCSYEVVHPQDRDKLDLFLYGSNLQLTLNNFGETIITPLQRLQALFSGRSGSLAQPRKWAAVTVAADGVPGSTFGLFPAGVDSPEATLLVFNDYPAGTSLALLTHTRSGSQALRGVVLDSRPLMAASQAVYLTTVRLEPAPEAQGTELLIPLPAQGAAAAASGRGQSIGGADHG